jgi:hypothetical protein
MRFWHIPNSLMTSSVGRHLQLFMRQAKCALRLLVDQLHLVFEPSRGTMTKERCHCTIDQRRSLARGFLLNPTKGQELSTAVPLTYNGLTIRTHHRQLGTASSEAGGPAITENWPPHPTNVNFIPAIAFDFTNVGLSTESSVRSPVR